MKKVLLLLGVIICVFTANGASITYLVQIQHKDIGVTSPVKLWPTGITEKDINWSITLIQGGSEMCSKTSADQPPTWNVTGGTMMLNLSIFDNCGKGAAAGDRVRITMTINKPGHTYDKVSASSEVVVVNGATLAMWDNGIIFVEPAYTNNFVDSIKALEKVDY